MGAGSRVQTAEAKVKLLDVFREARISPCFFSGACRSASQPSLTAAAILLLMVAVVDASAAPVNIAAGGSGLRGPPVSGPLFAPLAAARVCQHESHTR